MIYRPHLCVPAHAHAGAAGGEDACGAAVGITAGVPVLIAVGDAISHAHEGMVDRCQ